MSMEDDTQTMTLAEIIAELQWLMQTTPKQHWVWERKRFDDPEHLIAWIYESLCDGEDPDTYALKLAGVDEYVAILGNREHSRRYARMMMLIRASLPFLIQALTRAGETPLESG